MQRERRDCRTVGQLLHVGRSIRETRRIHTEEVVGEHPTICIGIAAHERPPHLGLESNDVLERKLAHRRILSICDRVRRLGGGSARFAPDSIGGAR